MYIICKWNHIWGSVLKIFAWRGMFNHEQLETWTVDLKNDGECSGVTRAIALLSPLLRETFGKSRVLPMVWPSYIAMWYWQSSAVWSRCGQKVLSVSIPLMASQGSLFTEDWNIRHLQAALGLRSGDNVLLPFGR